MRDKLYKLYIEQELSTNKVAYKLGINQEKVRQLLREYKIPIRSRYALHRKPRKYRDKKVYSRYKTYESRCIEKNIRFDLTIEQFESIIKRNCHYCGDITGNYNGIDRLDGSKGYTLSNTIPCCPTCNRAKFTKSYYEFTEWLDRMADYRHKTV